MIFDHSRSISQATHLLQLCCQDIMRKGSISFNYSHFSSIYTAARFFLCTEILCSWEYRGKNVFLFFSSYTKSSVFTKLTRTTTFHLLLYQTMTSARSNCFQTRQGLSFRCVFRFLAQVSVAQHPAEVDNEKWCMMSCRRGLQCQNLVTKFPGSYHFPLLSLALPCIFLILSTVRKPRFVFSW